MKNPYLRIEFRVVDEDNSFRYRADTEEACVQWIEDHSPADLMGDVTFKIEKVYTTSRKNK